jgi:hypothetical protein
MPPLGLLRAEGAGGAAFLAGNLEGRRGPEQGLFDLQSQTIDLWLTWG